MDSPAKQTGGSSLVVSTEIPGDNTTPATNLRPPLHRVKTVHFGAQAPWDEQKNDDITHDQVFRLVDLEIDEESICSGLDCHRRFKVKEGYEMKDLPKFNDLTRYDIEEAQEMRLWNFEVGRLVAAVKSERPVLLEGPPEWYGPADSDGYNRMHIMATTMRYALDVCVHDNELLLLEHQPFLMSRDSFAGSYRNLIRDFDPDEGVIRYDKQIKLIKNNDEAYHSLVNYVTATLARVLTRTVTGKFWVENCIATVAKFASKLKVLGHDLPSAVSRTMEAQNDVNARLGELYPSEPNPLLARAAESGKRARGDTGDIDLMDTSGARYFLVVDSFSSGIVSLLSSSIKHLHWDEEVEQTADLFETSTVIYHSGFRQQMIHLCQERDGAIGAGADVNMTRCAGMIFDVCREIWSEMPSVEGPVGEHTTLIWNWTGLTRTGDLLPSVPGSKTWVSMKDVISGFVPYIVFCGNAPDILSHMGRAIIHFSDPTNPPKFFNHQACLAAARIRTTQYEKRRRQTLMPRNIKFQNVYDTAMAQEGALAGIQGDPTGPAAEALRRRHRETREKYRRAIDQVESWVLDECTVIITSLWYSYIVLAVVGILVGGGVALLAAEDRIVGVDPSNLTVLVWTAAGFLMVYFKSRRVENWPWRDFLQGRVVCRSVSEVHAVTKIDPQDLMAVLLRFEPRVNLQKSGPFRALFLRLSDGGFSIDVPPTVDAATAGGRIFVGVDSPNGPALVSLEARARESYTSHDQNDSKKDGVGLLCRDFVDPASYPMPAAKGADASGSEDGARSGSNELLPLYPLCTNASSWHKVKGVFVERALFC
ncbi:hypothetical protein QBC34DRAFT_403998 [Podospora aff. communis PSN243]|uniref:Uncharacterized protein n=1 Tax=Podospora aff. communis PSN243 TaxID=3040156 RepID=A0AAV9GQK4_9PEZI|nr:hypothetical protein QBC34DRAFT_403998 [Podospora aff. communis PSN243]